MKAKLYILVIPENSDRILIKRLSKTLEDLFNKTVNEKA